MSKSSFAVKYHLPQYRKTVIVLGVTSIYPNLNGVLFCTEDGRNHQVESCDMSDNMLCGMSIDYHLTEEDMSFDREWADKTESQFQVIDGRKYYYEH